MTNLEEFACLIKNRNKIDERISELTSRPASTGHIGEYLAKEIFEIVLDKSAAKKGVDGTFDKDGLKGSVNIKYYTSDYRFLIIDACRDNRPDYFLIFRGSSIKKTSSKDIYYPLDIHSVHLFESEPLVCSLKANRVQIGKPPSRATSVKTCYWEAAQIYPCQKNKDLLVSEKQKRQLALFQE